MTQSRSTLDLIKESEEEVHKKKSSDMHELGSLDTMFDLIGFYSSIEWLGIYNFYSSAIPFSQGNIKIEHGLVSATAPVTLNIIKKLKIPVFSSAINSNFEFCTPTGVSLLNKFKFEDFGNSIIEKTGFGAGQSNPKERSNCITAMLMSCSNYIYDDLCIIETNLDDLTPELVGYFMEKVFELEVNDAWTTNIIMKKNRPGIKISVLCPKLKVDQVVNMFKLETSTLGVRVFPVSRTKFLRKTKMIETRYGKVRVKVKLSEENQEINFSPEYEDCKKLANKHNIP